MLEGKLVRLREYRKEDVVLAHKYINDFEVKRLLVPGIPFPMRLEEEEKWYDSQSAFKDTYNFAIESLESGEYLGGCGINEVDWKNSVAVVGIFLGNRNTLHCRATPGCCTIFLISFTIDILLGRTPSSSILELGITASFAAI